MSPHLEGLFFETTALVKNVAAGPNVRTGIAQTAKPFKILATSSFARCEYFHVMSACYGTVIGALRRFPSLDQIAPFNDIYQDALEVLPVPRVPGGDSLLGMLTLSLKDRFKNSLITRRQVIHELEGERSNVLASVFVLNDGREIADHLADIDRCSCCCWPAGFPGRPTCDSEPGPSCRLQTTVLGKRDLFIQSVQRLKESRLDEAHGLAKLYPELEVASGLDLLRLVGESPGDFGDIVLFWEVPTKWAVLTRDRSFSVMADLRESDIRVFKIRSARVKSRERVKLTISGRVTFGRLINHSVSGVLVEIDDSYRIRKNDLIEVESTSLLPARTGKLKRSVLVGRGKIRHGIYFPGRIARHATTLTSTL
jgi:hypothetical protein